MKMIYKICLVNVAIAFVAALVFTMDSYNVESFMLALGLLSLGGGVINIIVSIILFLAKRKVWAKGYLLSAGILLLLGTFACSTMYLY